MNELDKKLDKIFSQLKDRNADPDSDDFKRLGVELGYVK